jgi:hypothetical protein
MGGGIVFGSYRRPDLAFTHARCITGCSVAALDMDRIDPELRRCIEVLEELPPEIKADLEAEWEHDDDITPNLGGRVVVAVGVDDLDDK